MIRRVGVSQNQKPVLALVPRGFKYPVLAWWSFALVSLTPSSVLPLELCLFLGISLLSSFEVSWDSESMKIWWCVYRRKVTVLVDASFIGGNDDFCALIYVCIHW